MNPFLPIVAFASLLGGCQAVAPQPEPRGSSAMATFDPKSPEGRGLKLARNRCADCHSVDYGESSPVPDAPSFAAIANSRGLTAPILAGWLEDHRNYPEEMYFEIPAEHIADLAAYMITLRRPEADPKP